jgi:hypothetical protein
LRDCKNFRLKVDTHTHAIRSRSVAELQYKLPATQQQHLARDIHSRWPVGLSQLIYNTHCMPPFPLCTLARTRDHPTPRPTAGVLTPKRVRRVASCMIQSSCWGFSFSRPGNWLMAILLHLLTAGSLFTSNFNASEYDAPEHRSVHSKKPTSKKTDIALLV